MSVRVSGAGNGANHSRAKHSAATAVGHERQQGLSSRACRRRCGMAGGTTDSKAA